jgi:thiamine-phosphate pyrophosphorylase
VKKTAKTKLNNFLSTDLYAITSAEHSLGRSNAEVVKILIENGVKVIQYREKNKPAAEMYAECLLIRELTRQNDVTFIVNDHVDLAILVDADGVHVGQDDLPPAAIRKLVGEDMLIGLSTHSPQQAQDAVELGGVDYIGVGPVFATNTKKDVCEPVGLAYLEYVAKNIALPFVAIGGIKEHNLKKVRESGAKIISLVTEIVGAQDIGAKISALRAVLK